MNQEPVEMIKVGDRPLRLSRPVLPHAARRLVTVIPQLNALNEAGKSQADAASALGVSIGSIRTWISLTGLSWNNLNRRGPYNRQKK
jgi:hypothetical protein